MTELPHELQAKLDAITANLRRARRLKTCYEITIGILLGVVITLVVR